MAWLDRESLPSIPAAELSAWIQDHVVYHGDKWLLPVVVAALAIAPECVRESVLAEVAALGVGRDSAAWTSSSLFVDRDGAPRRRVIVLGPDVDVRIVLHEAAHVWHGPRVTEDTPALPAIGALGEAGLARWAADNGWAARLDAHSSHHENLVDGCAAAWMAAA